ncbi:hypothetical protein AC244_33795 [Ensifer adhaerens]|uniref:Uncharacterized protein n=1 Tax=Ensifer adhaerens TaxID=106592 RepID=A0A0L8BD61_ENSAD|nr:hypothetical protein AC244_33795 [Ensifer adhaerens]
MARSDRFFLQSIRVRSTGHQPCAAHLSWRSLMRLFAAAAAVVESGSLLVPHLSRRMRDLAAGPKGQATRKVAHDLSDTVGDQQTSDGLHGELAPPRPVRRIIAVPPGNDIADST